MAKKYTAAYLSILVIFVYLTIFNMNLRYSDPVACSTESGSTFRLPKVAGPVVLTPQQRWKKRVEESGNCKLIPVVPSWDNYFDMVEKQEKCAHVKFFGGPKNIGKGDGAKSVCMDSGLEPQSGACTVMSFGINNDWSFDDAMAAWGCEVFSFDPTIAQPDHLRGERIHFHNLGLSGKNGSIAFRKSQVPVDSYRGVLEHVGLVNRTIDYLKIDIEGSEVDFFENVLYNDMDALQHVKQLGVEIHVFNQNVQSRDRFWKIYHRLECLGFRKVFSEQNTYPPTAYVYNKIRSKRSVPGQAVEDLPSFGVSWF